jgi:hypothetical protein
VAFSDSHSKSRNEYWESLQENLREVSKWPKWMRGEADDSTSPEAGEQPAGREDDDPEAAA